MRLEGKRVAIFAADLYEDLELWYPLIRLREEGAEVVVVGPAAREYQSKHGYPVKAQVAAKDVRAADFHAVVVPGGYAPDHMRRSPEMVALLRENFLAGKPTAAICHAGWMLASAGILEGKTVTSWFSIKDDLIHAGAEWTDREVVVDGNLITSRMPDDLPAFLRALIAALEKGR
jgi:protease I